MDILIKNGSLKFMVPQQLKIETAPLSLTYPANATTGIITHSANWNWLAGVEVPINNTSGKIKYISFTPHSVETVGYCFVFMFSEYNADTAVYTLNTAYGEGGKCTLNQGEKLAVGNDVKYITVRLGSPASSTPLDVAAIGFNDCIKLGVLE